MTYDLVIQGGLAVLPSGPARCDIGISGGKIAAIEDKLPPGNRTIDATGKIIVPGGIDSHCHIEEPSSGIVRNAETFASATGSAAAGGTTTVISFSTQTKGGTILDNLRNYQEKARNSYIDYCFHMIVTDPNERVLDELPGLIAEGHRSLKVFMTYDPLFVGDEGFLKILALAKQNNALVTVHAENHAAIKYMIDALSRAGLTDMKHHAWSKPIVVEREAVHRAIAFAELLDMPIQIFHVSGDEPAQEIARAQQRGLKIFGETCPQYLFLTKEDLDRPGFEGAKYVCSPALRTPADQEALWGHLKSGVLGVVTSDHAPNRYDDPHGKMAFGKDAPFHAVPNGVPGLETRMPLLFSEGVVKGRIDLETFAAITSGNAARLFGLDDRKGSIAVGLDADLAVFDPDKTVVLHNGMLHHAMDYTPYEGMSVTGWPSTTLSRGEVVWDGENIVATAGRGQFLPRQPYEFIAPNGRHVVPFDAANGIEVGA
jgi:dihydropyrimidinase